MTFKWNETIQEMQESGLFSRPLHDPVRIQIREKLVSDDEMYEGAIQEVIEFLEKGQVREAFFMLRDIHIASFDREWLKKKF